VAPSSGCRRLQLSVIGAQQPGWLLSTKGGQACPPPAFRPAQSRAKVIGLAFDPVGATPVVLQSADISDSTSFLFNAAISPDRRHDGAISAFGNNFVIQYNVSGKLSGINPRIVAGSSVNGGPLSSLLVINGVGPYRDGNCRGGTPPSDDCRWGDYAAATPDPRPVVIAGREGRGVVWGTNQFSGLLNPPPTTLANWRTQIFELKP
jgi:hypothetical protein